jgi:hypothetical protein
VTLKPVKQHWNISTAKPLSQGALQIFAYYFFCFFF